MSTKFLRVGFDCGGNCFGDGLTYDVWGVVPPLRRVGTWFMVPKKGEEGVWELQWKSDSSGVFPKDAVYVWVSADLLTIE